MISFIDTFFFFFFFLQSIILNLYERKENFIEQKEL